MKNQYIALFVLFGILLKPAVFSKADESFSFPAHALLAEVHTEKGPLTIRKEPDAHSKKIGKIKNGSFVSVVESTGDWFLISVQDETGYVMAEYLTIHEDLNPEILNYRLLQKGDCDDDVVALKQRLMELGYFRDNSKLTNRFNDTLEQRIKMFQRQNGCEEDGIASPETQILLFSENAMANQEPLPAVPTHYRAENTQNASSNTGWKRITCMCCGGDGCSCCDNTGFIWVPSDTE